MIRSATEIVSPGLGFNFPKVRTWPGLSQHVLRRTDANVEIELDRGVVI